MAHGFKWLLGPIALARSEAEDRASKAAHLMGPKKEGGEEREKGWGQGRGKWKGKREEEGGERWREAGSQFLPQEQAPGDITSFH